MAGNMERKNQAAKASNNYIIPGVPPSGDTLECENMGKLGYRVCIQSNGHGARFHPRAGLSE